MYSLFQAIYRCLEYNIFREYPRPRQGSFGLNATFVLLCSSRILPPQKGLKFPGGGGFCKAKKFKENKYVKLY